MKTSYIIVHFFSGRRRMGDLQMYLEHLNSSKEFNVTVLSVDLAVDRTKCDLMIPKQRQKWDDLLCSGRVAAVVMGPPCETFTAARENELPGCSVRPIRTAAEPWGKQGCKNHEITQLHTGNTLIQFALKACARMVCTGGMALMEHPAQPPKPESVSIWQVEEAQILREAPCSDQLAFHQSIHGAESKKPTSILVVRMQKIRKYIFKNQLGEEESKGLLTLLGKDENGKFKTARAKEYPPSLNKAIAMTISEHLEDAHHFGEEAEQEMPHNEWYKKFEVAFDPYSADMEMHADYRKPKAKEVEESDSDESWIDQLARALEESVPAEETSKEKEAEKIAEEEAESNTSSSNMQSPHKD